MTKLLTRLSVEFPHFKFVPGESFFWSAKNNEIQYVNDQLSTMHGSWSLLHELGHAICNHQSYGSDIELLILERDAWEKAREIAQKYNLSIDENHVEDCMDTYRDWLHQRSRCPRCAVHSVQTNNTTYCCYNCGQKWTVTVSRFCRPYRLKKQQKNQAVVTA